MASAALSCCLPLAGLRPAASARHRRSGDHRRRPDARSKPASITAAMSSYPASGLEGNLLRLPLIGVSIGISSIAEIQIDGGLYNRLTITERNVAPLSDMVTATGDSTSSVEDMVDRHEGPFLSEGVRRPAFGFRFATKLPNASNESGLGLDTTDFFASRARGQDRPVGSLRRQRRSGDPGRSDAGRPAERRPDLRLLVGPGADAGGRTRRRDQRPTSIRARASRRLVPDREASSASARATPSGAGGAMPLCSSA